MAVPSKPLLIYDGDCGFCRRWIARWERATGDRVDYAPYQEAASGFPKIPRERFAEAVQLVEPDGQWSRGAEAVFRALAYAPGRGAGLWFYDHVPGFAGASEGCYRLVARHRPAFTRLTQWGWGAHLVPPGERLTTWVFLRLLAVIYGIAFVSLWTQISGLAGSEGILPARDYLTAIGEHFGPVRYWFAPTLCWLHASDGALNGLCASGVLLSILLAAGVAPVPCLAGLGVAYLSLATVCREFLWFQWDGLLLETGFLAIFLASWKWRSRPISDPSPSPGALWLLRWLLFRLMVSSAVVKLASGDTAWRGLTALTYHYETQPLPPWTAWYAHHLPLWFQQASVVGVFAVEGLVPFLIFAPRRIRFAGCAAMAGLQGLILVTGNYCFFNLLALALCVLLLDDGVWPRRWREGVARARVPSRSGGWGAWIRRPVLVAVFLISLVPLMAALHWPLSLLGSLPRVYDLASPLRIVNSYGLFAIMTTERSEIIVEGSADGLRWLPYEFRYKPGDLRRRPGFVAPHQPRLDWQMWFASLSDYRREPWFLSFCRRLLMGSRPVLGLLGGNPFPTAPPRYIRAVVYDYHFTDAATRRASGAWWSRTMKGLYCPVLTLEDGHLAAAPAELQRP